MGGREEGVGGARSGLLGDGPGDQSGAEGKEGDGGIGRGLGGSGLVFLGVFCSSFSSFSSGPIF